MPELKVFWLTPDHFLNVDLPIIRSFENHIRIDWHIKYATSRLNTYSFESICREVTNPNVSITQSTQKYRYRDPRNILEYLKLCLKICSNKYDAIYLSDFGLPYLPLILYCLVGKKRVLFPVHDVKVHIGAKSGSVIQRLSNLTFKLFQNFHFFSKTQEALFAESYPNKTQFYCPLGLVEYGKPTVFPDPNAIHFLFFGTIRENKGLDLFLKSVQGLDQAEKQKIRITIAGKCDHWEAYQGLIQDPAIFDLKIEVVPNDAIPNLFGKSHYLVLPYKDVTQSGPLFISYTYGKPAIVPDLAGFKEFVEDQGTGYLYKAESESSLTETLKTVIHRHADHYADMVSKTKAFSNSNLAPEILREKYLEFFKLVSQRSTHA